MPPDHQKSIFCVPRPPKINIFSPRITKIKQNHYFLSLDDRKSVCSIPDHQKSILCALQTTKTQYFLSLELSLDDQISMCSIPDHQKSIFCVPRPPNFNILCPRATKNQYFLFLVTTHH